MHITDYNTTVEIHISFTDTEETMIEHCRTEPIGQYWEKDERTQPFSLETILALRNDIGVCIGAEDYTTTVNIFSVGENEHPEDIPKNGELAPVAQRLYNDLTLILKQWGYIN